MGSATGLFLKALLKAGAEKEILFDFYRHQLRGFTDPAVLQALQELVGDSIFQEAEKKMRDIHAEKNMKPAPTVYHVVGGKRPRNAELAAAPRPCPPPEVAELRREIAAAKQLLDATAKNHQKELANAAKIAFEKGKVAGRAEGNEKCTAARQTIKHMLTALHTDKVQKLADERRTQLTIEAVGMLEKLAPFI